MHQITRPGKNQPNNICNQVQVYSFGEIIFVADSCPKIGSNLWYSKALQFKDTWSAVFCPWIENSYSSRKMFDFCIAWHNQVSCILDWHNIIATIKSGLITSAWERRLFWSWHTHFTLLDIHKTELFFWIIFLPYNLHYFDSPQSIA